MAGGKGTTPIHNKKPKKKEKEELDDTDKAYQQTLKDNKNKEKELIAQQKGKGGPLNTGQQGIKKSGKK